MGVKAFELLVGIVFVFATAAYWIFERERAIRLSQFAGARSTDAWFATPGS